MIYSSVLFAFLFATVGFAQKTNEENPSDQFLIAYGKETMRQFKDSLNARWQLVQEDELTGIKIFQLQHQNGTLASLMANATSEHPPELFFKEFYSRAEQIPEWTDIVTISRKLKQVDPRTRVIFQNLKAKAPVPLADREFLILQRAEANFVANEGLSYTVAYRGIDYKSPLIPKRAPGVKRAKVGVSGFLIRPNTSRNPSGTEFTWISTVGFNYDEVPRAVGEIFERFNLILYTDALLQRVQSNANKV